MKRIRTYSKGLVLGIILGMVISFLLVFAFKEKVTDPIHTMRKDFDSYLDKKFLGYTAVDFEDAILGASTKTKKLIVLKQELTVPTEITKSGLFDLNIFAKVKQVDFVGHGDYVIDLSDMSRSAINVDKDLQTVTICIDHPYLEELCIDIDKTKYEDTKNGLLAFGDLSMKMEQYGELELQVLEQMREELNSDEMFAKANTAALQMAKEIYQPLVTSVASGYKTIIAFND